MRDTKTGLPEVKKRDTKLNKWFSGHNVAVSLSYQYQLGLYLYLRNAPCGLFCIGFLRYEDYLNPHNYDPFHENNLVSLVEFRINLVQFQKTIDYATKWYHDHITTYTSPEMTSSDREWFRFGYPEL